MVYQTAQYESLQDKLAQLRDAREALDALREDHREKKRIEMEELERQRQIQMAQKLDIMRQKKHVRYIMIFFSYLSFLVCLTDT
jgi:growth factor-regulated tyrosine kinase substrate